MEKEISEIDAMRIIDETLKKLTEEGAKERVLHWALQKYSPEVNHDNIGVIKKSKGGRKKSKKKGAKPLKKTKQNLTIVKELNLREKGKKSFIDFVEEKKPKSIKEKCVVSVYYLYHILRIEQICINHVYTCFKNMNWRIPPDLKNMLHQSASEGWLDTSSQNDIKITTQGDNLVEQDLPRKRGNNINGQK
jgi:hypothetical protein